jgi:endo-1,4-beta-xylanase
MKQLHFVLSIVVLLFFTNIIYGQNFPVVVQAESGTPGSDFRIVDTLGARAVTIKTNFINTLNPGNNNRVITFQVTFPDSGTYDLYARILVGKNTWDDDSYFYASGFGTKNPSSDDDWIRANGLAVLGYTISLDVVGGSGTAANGIWKWVNMSKYMGDSPPVSFRVEQGSLSQTFQIGGRENGLYIDKLVFGRTGLYFTVYNLNRGEPGSELPPGETPLGPPIAAGQSKFLGCAWDYEQAPYFAGYWNQLTPGNAGKWGSVEYTRDVMNWTVLDSAYSVTRKYHMPIKEHTLIWGAQQPPWIGGLDSAAQRQEIEEWFSVLANRYDTIEYIDVVNEPIHNAPNGMIPWGSTTPNVDYADALGGAGLTGWDWVITAFRLARQYFPDSKLILNEYSVINNTSTTQNYIEIINLLKAENLIDGIGEQAHAFTTNGVSTATLKNNLDLLAATGIPIYLTEVDIDGQTDLAQLQEIRRVFPLFWEHPAVEGITFWGFRYPVWRQQQGANLITNDDIERPAITWLKAYVNDTLTLTQSIEVSAAGDTDSIYTGGMLQMSAVVLPVNTTIPNVTWSVTPSGIATIDSYGLLSPTAAGKVTVKATAWDGSGVTGTLDITVSNILTESVTVSSSGNQDSIFVGETLQMMAAIMPENTTNPAVRWTVTPPGFAQISSDGLLTAIASGKATVKATAKDGSEVSDSMDITILNRLIQSITVSAADNKDTISIGDSLRMNAVVLPENATHPYYTWSLTPDGLAEIDTSGLLIAIAKGKVTVIATAKDESGVTGTLDITIIEKATITLDNLDYEKILVYPNPSVNGNFTIRGIEKIQQIELLDLAGIKLFGFRKYNESSINIHVNISPGIYILRLFDREQALHKKIVIN